jgi:hypothetical protein
MANEGSEATRQRDTSGHRVGCVPRRTIADLDNRNGASRDAPYATGTIPAGRAGHNDARAHRKPRFEDAGPDLPARGRPPRGNGPSPPGNEPLPPRKPRYSLGWWQLTPGTG